ncbi:hypothetical protein C1645_815734 [Glomus cerebriforme]|uniref:Uncharacterized protein n=1 Tax=Glomus cerebriforme TaxID=658196 RepID=A0A397TDZ8_9GLOM|nr:hypothetical protein C1645_815734 [Glomus cerebriforme]
MLQIILRKNKSIEEISKNSEVITKANDNDDIYFYFKDKKEKVTNEEVSKVSDMVDDNNNCSYNNDFEEKMPDDSDVNEYHDKYSKYNRSYYYHNRRYEKKVSLMMSPIISLVIA